MFSVHAIRLRNFLASAALTSLAVLDLPAAMAQQVREPLPPVEISPARPRKLARPAAREAQSPRRAAARRPATASVAPKPVVPTAAAQTPLNTNAVPESASRLGLTVREIPATVEVISAKTMREQGYRTVSEVAQGAVGVTSGDNPADACGVLDARLHQ
ncbi:outer membrane receptor for ferric coprogen and ferric-rhodotorulic acid [Bradyrhizobium sp. LM3.2]